MDYDDEEQEIRQRQAAEFTFIKRGVPKEKLNVLLDPTTPQEDVRKLVEEFNSSNVAPKPPYNKQIITLDNGREIKIYFDQDGGANLGFGTGLER